MAAGQWGYLFGAFLVSLLIAMIAVIVCKVARFRLTVCYGIAGALTFAPPLISAGGPDALSLLGALLAAGVVFWRFKQDEAAQSKRLGASTRK